MALQTHINRRNAKYHHRIRVPLDLVGRLGRRELTASLKTSCPIEAKQRASLASHYAHLIFNHLRKHPMLSEDQINALVREFYLERLQQDEIRRVEDKPDVDWKNDEAVHFLIEHVGDNDADIETAIQASGKTVADFVADTENAANTDVFLQALAEGNWALASSDADKMLAKYGVTLDPKSPEYRRLCLGLLRATIQSLRTASQRATGEWGTEPEDALFKIASVTPPAQVTPAFQHPAPAAPSLEQLFEKYLGERSKEFGAKGVGEARTSLKWFLDYVGSERGIEGFSKKDISAFKDALLEVPRDFRKYFKTDNIMEAIELNKKAQRPTLDLQTINGKRLAEWSPAQL
jgi:hypothetical protein